MKIIKLFKLSSHHSVRAHAELQVHQILLFLIDFDLLLLLSIVKVSICLIVGFDNNWSVDIRIMLLGFVKSSLG